MDENAKKEVESILLLLRGCLTKNCLSIGFNNDTNELLIFDTDIYLEEERIDGLKVCIDDLVN